MDCEECEAIRVHARSVQMELDEATRERDGLLEVVAALLDVVTPVQFGQVRRRLADRDIALPE
jgi:hypothetical protein